MELANAKSIPIVPVSSGASKFRGHTISQSTNSIIVDLTKMKRILWVDRTNRVAMVEAGVTYADFVTELSKQDLRTLLPLLSRPSKSVVAGCLDREPRGRIYSKSCTVCYAFVQCNEKVDRYAVKVMMLAKDENPILSTGEFEFIKEDFE